jgi:FxsC-like protein
VDYYFFLSYARGDDDQFIQQFFRDLSGEVRSHAGLRADEEVGFVDAHSIELGAVWSTRLMTALSRCRSFIAMCSPRYFLSEACGKEWTVFAERLREYERDNGVRLAALLPLMWLPQRHTPKVAADLQYTSGDLPEAYGRNGLRQLMRLQRHRDSYLEFVSELARQIVDMAEAHPLPPLRAAPDFAAVRNAFRGAPAQSAGEAPEAARANLVHFVVAAPSRDELDSEELRDGRTRREFYGERPHEWAPYQPALSAPLAQYAADIAEQRSFDSAVTDIGGLVSRVESARERNQIVVLLVDVWATRLRRQRQALAECDARDWRTDQPTTAVMVPSSHDDEETQANWRHFTHAVRDIFAHRALHGDVMFRPSILTHHAFGADLQVVLEVARNRTFVTGRVFRRPPDPPSALPILQGP